jgi:hypothetical protein
MSSGCLSFIQPLYYNLFLIVFAILFYILVGSLSHLQRIIFSFLIVITISFALCITTQMRLWKPVPNNDNDPCFTPGFK